MPRLSYSKLRPICKICRRCALGTRKRVGNFLMDPLERFLKLQPVKSALDGLSMSDPEISTRARNGRSRIDKKFQRNLDCDGA